MFGGSLRNTDMNAIFLENKLVVNDGVFFTILLADKQKLSGFCERVKLFFFIQ